jgi:hypothetical protein
MLMFSILSLLLVNIMSRISRHVIVNTMVVFFLSKYDREKRATKSPRNEPMKSGWKTNHRRVEKNTGKENKKTLLAVR